MKSNHQSVLVALVCLLTIPLTGIAANKDHVNVDRGNLGVKGYDPVAYFTDGKAERGNPKLAADYDGVVYHFASKEHRAAFEKDPNRYVPAYGGWCATAFAEDHGKVDIDPKSFKVTEGRLYLFYNGLLGNARKVWIKDEPGNIVKANQNWKKLVGE